MTKLVLDTVTSGFRSGELVTSNNTATIKAIENTLSRDGTSPNFMQAQLDMNGFNIINQGNPVTVQGFDWQGSWITGTTYQDGMVVEFSGSAYIALLTHVAGVFATDLANGNWQLVASASLPSQAGATSGILRSDGTIASWHQSSPYIFTLLSSVDAVAARSVLGTYDGSDAVKLTGSQTVDGAKTFTTGPIAPTAAVNTNTTQLATTAFVIAQSKTTPLFAARNSSPQSLTTNVATKITLSVENFDTNSYFSSSRFTPTIAGYYQLNGGAALTGTAMTAAYVSIYLNGSEYVRGGQLNLTSGNSSVFGGTVSTIVFLNGSTDYVELWGLAVATTPSVAASPFSNFSGLLIRTT